MAKEGMGVANKLILAFVMLLIGTILIGVIANQTNSKTTTTTIASETHNVLPTILTGRNVTAINSSIVYTLTNAPTGWKVSDCPITSFVLTNSSGQAFTDTTDYVLTASAGTYTLVNSATAVATLPLADNNTYASYHYCGDEYLNSSWGRSVLNLVAGFFAIALLLVAVALFYSVGRDTGIV